MVELWTTKGLGLSSNTCSAESIQPSPIYTPDAPFIFKTLSQGAPLAGGELGRFSELGVATVTPQTLFPKSGSNRSADKVVFKAFIGNELRSLKNMNVLLSWSRAKIASVLTLGTLPKSRTLCVVKVNHPSVVNRYVLSLGLLDFGFDVHRRLWPDGQ